MTRRFSRRAIVGALASSSVISSGAKVAAFGLADAKLIDLGHQFDRLAKQMDGSCEAFDRLNDEYFAELDRVEAEILSTPAQSFEGYRVKARAACWALLGDIDPQTGSTTDKRIGQFLKVHGVKVSDPTLTVFGVAIAAPDCGG